MDLAGRQEEIVRICTQAGDLALEFFQDQDRLVIDRKGQQDFVSQADREVELAVRRMLQETFPDDAIVGEEHAPSAGSSGFTWVIDPIDGTTNFINGIPAWTVVVAGVSERATQVGVIHDPCYGETYAGARGQGATLNGAQMRVRADRGLEDGTIGVGYSSRVYNQGVIELVRSVIDAGAMFYRNASGALSLAYVASGRLLGYAEEHMNAWDCLAGQLLVAEAGGRVEEQDAEAMITDGGRVIAGTQTVFDDLLDLSVAAWERGRQPMDRHP